MRLELTGRHFTITTTMRRAVQRQLVRLERLLNDNALSAQVVITREKARFQVEITLHARGEHFLHAAATGIDWTTALASASDKIERQAHKLKSKWTETKRRGISAAKAGSAAPRPERGARAFGGGGGDGAGADAGADAEVRIIRARRYPVKPMSLDEAALEVGEANNAFLVFRDSANDAVMVLFRRPDGNLGLIEPEA